MKDRTMLPSQRGEQRSLNEQELKEKQLEQAERLKRAMRVTFSSPDGLIVLEFIKKECQFGEPILGAIAGQIDEKATLYQAMRQNLYLKIRKMLTFNILKEVEYHED